jgi:hypothetical protein
MDKTKKKPRKDQNWQDLYKYIENEIMGYGLDLKLNKQMVLRLKGLSEGKLIANKKIESQANYSPECILTTFKLYKTKILNVLDKKDFSNQNQKFNYIMAIIDNNINDVALMLKRKEQSVELSKNTTVVESIKSEGMTYQEKKEKEKENKHENEQDKDTNGNEVLDELW